MSKANKVILNGGVLIDLTADNVTEADVAAGKIFHKADGTQVAGALEEYAGAIDVKITFTIDGTRYLAEEGMTWSEWTNSSYNTAGYICSAEGDVDLVTDATAGNMVLCSGGNVYAADAIGAGAAYTTSGLISFVVDGVSYRAKEGMTWSEWADTIFNHDGYECNTTAYLVTDATGENAVEYNGDKVKPSNAITGDAVYTTATLITFTIDTVSYYATDGMTWYEWANSLYNTPGYICSGNSDTDTDTVIDSANENVVVRYNGTDVYGADAIVDDAAYTTVTYISFTIGETSYQAESGMTWYTWANSSYNTGGYICSGDTETDTVTDATAENTVQYNAVDVCATDTLVSAAAYTTASVSTEA